MVNPDKLLAPESGDGDGDVEPETADNTAANVAAIDAADAPLQMEFGSYDGTDGPYGAISMASNGGKVLGYVAYDEPDKATASKLALEGCQEKAGADGGGCKIDVIFWNSCAAFASTNDGGYGTGWGDTGAIACGWALDGCKDYNKSGCKADAYVCSPGGKNGTCDGGLTIEGDTTSLRSD